MTVKRLRRVHEWTARIIGDGRVAGAASFVSLGGRVLHWDAQGFADAEAGIRLEEDAMFRLASMTKPIVGVAVMILAERGLLRLDDPLGEYLPEYRRMRVAVPNEPASADPYRSDPGAPAGTVANEPLSCRTVPAHREITIRDLLSHCSGLGQGPIGFNEIGLPLAGDTLAVHVPKWAHVPLDFQPGTQTGYSPIAAFDLLGRVAEIVSGLPLDRYLRQSVFGPLGMKDTTFAPSEEQWRRVAAIYECTEQGLVKFADQRIFCRSEYFSGAAGLLGTLEDYTRFAQMLANEGGLDGVRILGSGAVSQMRTAQLADSVPGFPRGQTWGLSMRVITDGDAAGTALSTGCFGWSGAWGTHFWIDPRRNAAAVFMTNIANAGGADALTAREFETAVERSFAELNL